MIAFCVNPSQWPWIPCMSGIFLPVNIIAYRPGSLLYCANLHFLVLDCAVRHEPLVITSHEHLTSCHMTIVERSLLKQNISTLAGQRGMFWAQNTEGMSRYKRTRWETHGVFSVGVAPPRLANPLRGWRSNSEDNNADLIKSNEIKTRERDTFWDRLDDCGNTSLTEDHFERS